MDNFTEKKEEKKIDSQTAQNQEIGDIQFEEVVDEIQKELNYEVKESLEEEDEDDAENKEDFVQKIVKPSVSSNTKDKNIKKYVVYVEPYNIDFMESLSANERREIINKVLKEQYGISIENKKKKARNRFLIHVSLACITFIICFPLLFLFVNKATEITISNYKQAKTNVRKLYREKGKIKIKKSESVKKIQY